MSIFTFIAAIRGLEITPYLPPGVTRLSTVTTTLKDFENEKFKFVSLESDDADTEGNYDIRKRYEKTVFTLDPTITTGKSCHKNFG